MHACIRVGVWLLDRGLNPRCFMLSDDKGPIVKAFRPKGQRGKDAAPQSKPKEGLKDSIKRGLLGLGISASEQPPLGSKGERGQRGNGAAQGGADARFGDDDWEEKVKEKGGKQGASKDGRPVWKGADAGTYRITDKVTLKTHRDSVRKGRKHQLDTNSFVASNKARDIFFRCIGVASL